MIDNLKYDVNCDDIYKNIFYNIYTFMSSIYVLTLTYIFQYNIA